MILRFVFDVVIVLNNPDMQVVCPFLLDQFYWAERLHWLGVAPAPLQRQHLIPDNDDPSSIHNAAEVLRGAIKSALFPEIKAQATSIADRLSFEVHCLNGTLQPLTNDIATSVSIYCLIKEVKNLLFFTLLLCLGWDWRSPKDLEGKSVDSGSNLSCNQGLIYRPVRSNRRGPVPVYRTGLAGNRWKPVKFKFKIACSTGSDRLTGRFDRFTDRFDW